jgi:predicted metal-dependent phosphoesterase TrpH
MPRRPLKVELHTHTNDDPSDRIPYSTKELIDHAALLKYDALAVTLHDRQLDLMPWQSYARDRGVVLIPGVEQTIEGKHVLLLNFPAAEVEIRTFSELRDLKRRCSGLVVAPHAFFPATSCLRGLLDRHADLFDAVEMNAMFTRQLDFNRRAEAWAARHGNPIVGNCDVHRLEQMGTTYSLVDAEPDAGAICAAIADGRVRVERRPLSVREAASIMFSLLNPACSFGRVAVHSEVPGA